MRLLSLPSLLLHFQREDYPILREVRRSQDFWWLAHSWWATQYSEFRFCRGAEDDRRCPQQWVQDHCTVLQRGLDPIPRRLMSPMSSPWWSNGPYCFCR